MTINLLDLGARDALYMSIRRTQDMLGFNATSLLPRDTSESTTQGNFMPNIILTVGGAAITGASSITGTMVGTTGLVYASITVDMEYDVTFRG